MGIPACRWRSQPRGLPARHRSRSTARVIESKTTSRHAARLSRRRRYALPGGVCLLALAGVVDRVSAGDHPHRVSGPTFALPSAIERGWDPITALPLIAGQDSNSSYRLAATDRMVLSRARRTRQIVIQSSRRRCGAEHRPRTTLWHVTPTPLIRKSLSRSETVCALDAVGAQSGHKCGGLRCSDCYG